MSGATRGLALGALLLGGLVHAQELSPSGTAQALPPPVSHARREAPRDDRREQAAHASGSTAPRRPAMTPEIAREISAERYAELFAQHPPPPSVSTAWAYSSHGVVALLPAAGWTAAWRVSGQPFWQVGVNAFAGALLGLVPARLGYVYSNPSRPRWREMDVVLFTLSLVLTPPLAGLGTLTSQSLFFGGNAFGGRAYLGATLGALVGHLAGLAFTGLLAAHLPAPELGGFRFGLGLAFVGTGATLGQALASPPGGR